MYMSSPISSVVDIYPMSPDESRGVHCLPLPTSHLNTATLLRGPFNAPAHGPLHGRRNTAVPLPLLGGLALGGPGVDGGNLLLEGGVDEAVALERVEAAELGGDDERGEGLAAAAWGSSVIMVSGV